MAVQTSLDDSAHPKKSKRAPKVDKQVRACDVRGLKHLRALQPLLEELHKVGTQRDRAGNRDLHMDHYCSLILLWLYSPAVDSLRGLQQASQLKKVQKLFKVPRASLGSLSESVSIFDPERLKHLSIELANQLPEPARQGKLSAFDQTLVAVDGSVIKVLARVARLAWNGHEKGKPSCFGYRLHTHFEILRGIPKRIEATSANPKGPDAETAVLERTIEPDHCYVVDRGYQKFALWNKIHAVGSSYLCRLRDRIEVQTLQDRELSQEDVEAGVLSDQLVCLGKKTKTDHAVRLICVRCSPHTSRGVRHGRNYSSSGPSSDGVLRIATNLLDVPAELIAKLYKTRWSIELFFRMFKQLLGCRHLLSTKQNGVEIQVYCALIACMLILIYTGQMPTKRTFEMLCFYMAGWAELSEVMRHIRGLKPPADNLSG